MGLQPVTYKRTKINFSLSSFHRSFTNTADVLVSVFEFWKLILAVETENMHRSSLLCNLIQLLAMSQIWDGIGTTFLHFSMCCYIWCSCFYFVHRRFIPQFYDECCWFNVLPNYVTRNTVVWHRCVDLAQNYITLFNLYYICLIMFKQLYHQL